MQDNTLGGESERQAAVGAFFVAGHWSPEQLSYPGEPEQAHAQGKPDGGETRSAPA